MNREQRSTALLVVWCSVQTSAENPFSQPCLACTGRRARDDSSVSRQRFSQSVALLRLMVVQCWQGHFQFGSSLITLLAKPSSLSCIVLFGCSLCRSSIERCKASA